MQFVSTRGGGEPSSLEAALQRGIAADGGLFVPTQFPHFVPTDFAGDADAPAIAKRMLAPFFEGSSLSAHVASIAEAALSFPLPLVSLQEPDADLSVLELFHGPTAAFKDVGARFLAACLTRLEAEGAPPASDLTILVATSGDTGGAVASAFHGKPGIRVVILFPRGLVSPRQEHQLCCWGDNVTSLSVEGPFDICQALVKAAFADEDLRARVRLSSANSINIGRLLPQAAYYAASSLQVWRRTGRAANYIVPTGNLGNALACLWARRMGLPIGQIVLATNANRTIPDYLASGEWQPRDSVATLASAMDVGNPSNMERLRFQHPQFEEVAQAISAHAVSDQQIREQIRLDAERRHQVWCPHTATALHAYDQLPAPTRRAAPWVVVATAHPAKFESIVEPLIGRTVDVPLALATILGRPAQAVPIQGTLQALAAQL